MASDPQRAQRDDPTDGDHPRGGRRRGGGDRVDPALILELALGRDPVATMEATGLSQARISQIALHLSVDPQVEADHPELVRRVRAVVEQGKARRSADWLK